MDDHLSDQDGDGSLNEAAKRSRFRFSLKSLLVLVTLLAVGLGLFAKRFHDKRSRIIAIEQMGATLGVKASGPVWLRKLFQDERYFWDVSGVAFDKSRRLTDDDLRQLVDYLEGFKIKQFALRGSQVTNAGLVNLRKFGSTIIVLDLSDTAVLDEGIVHIKELTSLKDIHLKGTAITETGKDELQRALPNCTINN